MSFDFLTRRRRLLYSIPFLWHDLTPLLKTISAANRPHLKHEAYLSHPSTFWHFWFQKFSFGGSFAFGPLQKLVQFIEIHFSVENFLEIEREFIAVKQIFRRWHNSPHDSANALMCVQCVVHETIQYIADTSLILQVVRIPKTWFSRLNYLSRYASLGTTRHFHGIAKISWYLYMMCWGLRWIIVIVVWSLAIYMVLNELLSTTAHRSCWIFVV